jgi:uncharacterized protein (DUF697 family)
MLGFIQQYRAGCLSSEDPRMPKENDKDNEAALPEPAPTTGRDDRYAIAAKVVDRYVLWSGAAGLIPLPIIDITAVSGVQLQMLRRVAAIYGIKFTDNLGKSVLASLVGSIIPATSGMGLASAMKSVPVFGTTVAMVSMPALSAGATYIIGRVFINHFESGGTLLDFNPPDYREFIKEQTEKLKSKLDAPSGSQPTSAPTPPERASSSST